MEAAISRRNAMKTAAGVAAGATAALSIPGTAKADDTEKGASKKSLATNVNTRIIDVGDVTAANFMVFVPNLSLNFNPGALPKLWGGRYVRVGDIVTVTGRLSANIPLPKERKHVKLVFTKLPFHANAFSDEYDLIGFGIVENSGTKDEPGEHVFARSLKGTATGMVLFTYWRQRESSSTDELNFQLCYRATSDTQ